MSNRRTAPRTGRPESEASLVERCARLERLLAIALHRRAAAREELVRARGRLRTVGDDFVAAFEAIDARTDAAVAAAELRGRLADDLDLESALTVTLEHLLARFRPANVAIWLCNGRGDHALAAYGAGDVPRMQAEATVALLAREACPSLGSEPHATVFPDAAAAMVALPPGGGVLQGRAMVLVPIAHRGERSGAMMLLQGANECLSPAAPDAMAAIGALLGEHIDRIGRIVMRRSSAWPGMDAD
jgi:hypothetical protein